MRRRKYFVRFQFLKSILSAIAWFNIEFSSVFTIPMERFCRNTRICISKPYKLDFILLSPVIYIAFLDFLWRLFGKLLKKFCFLLLKEIFY